MLLWTSKHYKTFFVLWFFFFFFSIVCIIPLFFHYPCFILAKQVNAIWVNTKQQKWQEKQRVKISNKKWQFQKSDKKNKSDNFKQKVTILNKTWQFKKSDKNNERDNFKQKWQDKILQKKKLCITNCCNGLGKWHNHDANTWKSPGNKVSPQILHGNS